MNKEKLKEINKLENELKKIKEKYTSDLPKPEKDQILKPKRFKKRWLYLSSFVLNLCIIIFWVFVFFAKLLNLYTIIGIIITIPLFMINGLAFFILLFLDWRRLKGLAVENFSGAYIIADFLMSNKRTKSLICPLNKDGISFTIGKRDYIVDKEVIWYDERNRPHCYYVPELPNPLKFSFKRAIESYFEIMAKIEQQPELVLKAIQNDIAFSSTNLQLFKKDKVFSDLNRTDDMVDKKTMNTFIIILGVIIFLLIIGLIIAVAT